MVVYYWLYDIVYQLVSNHLLTLLPTSCKPIIPAYLKPGMTHSLSVPQYPVPSKHRDPVNKENTTTSLLVNETWTKQKDV